MNPSRDIHFVDLLREENIICDLQATDRVGAIEELTGLLHRNVGGFKRDAAVAAIVAREMEAATIVAPGVAIPHTRREKLESILVAVGIARHGIDFHVQVDEPVKIVILILTPSHDPGGYMLAVATIAKVLGDENARRKLAVCASAREVLDMFGDAPCQLPPYLSARHVMDQHPVTLLESDDLKTAVDAFCLNRVMDVPIVDEEGDLRGVLSLEDLLSLSLPEHLIWMEDLSPILRMEPFVDVLRKNRETKAADFMRENLVTVHANVPAIQAAKMFITEGVRQIQVVDGRKLEGAIDLQRFTAQVLWA